MMKFTKIAIYAWFVLGVNVFVILWGAFVRATGSGAGCGSHWPLCNGVIVPRSPQVETVIEFTHRLTSGIALVLVIILLVWAFRAYPRGHLVRLGATLSLIFILTEAAVGAGLVKFAWVAQDASTGRVITMAVHLFNTFLLLATLALTAWWTTSETNISFKGKRSAVWIFGFALVGALVLGVSGAITALGDTLFPVASLAEGLRQDFSATAHLVLRLRVWHPVIAIIEGSYLILVSGILAMYSIDQLRPPVDGEPARSALQYRHFKATRFFSIFLIISVITQLLAGLINLLLLAPVWMQLVHLLLADLVWVILVLLAANQFEKSEAHETVVEPEPEPPLAASRAMKAGNYFSHYTDLSAD